MTDLLSPTSVDVRPIAGNIGAEIHGVDIAQPLDEPTVAGIREALLKHRVIFFRDQALDHATQVRFGRSFGELTYAHPFNDTPPAEHPEIHTVDTRRGLERYGEEHRKRLGERNAGRFGGWHSDVTPAVNPPFASILRADIVPDTGGDTTWTSLVSAYQAPHDIDPIDVERVLHRVTLLGDVPVGPDGRRSELIEGRAFGSDWEVAAGS